MYDELYHHGILGQRWGVRRFQNYDGSLTSRGRKRELKSAGQYKRALNDIDKGIAQERRDYSDSRNAVAWMHKQSDKLMKKANKKEATGDYADRFNKKIDKYEKAADDHNRQANEHMANVFKGQELTKKDHCRSRGKRLCGFVESYSKKCYTRKRIRSRHIRCYRSICSWLACCVCWVLYDEGN